MEENEIRDCLRRLDPDYYDRMQKILTWPLLMHDIFARSFARCLDDEYFNHLKVDEEIQLAKLYKQEMMVK